MRAPVGRIGAVVPVVVITGMVAASQLALADSAPAAAGVAGLNHAPLSRGPALAPGESGSAVTRALILSLRPDSGRTSRTADGEPATRTRRASWRARHALAVARADSVSCAAGAGLLPANTAQIMRFLVAHGYTAMAAAGIAGNIYQESQGNPESVGTGGGGLIGWTPLPPGFVTGNPIADLRRQLAALVAFNRHWAQFIPMLNAAGSPAQAADIYMTYFERPGFPAASNREAAASAVARACGITS